LLSSLFEHPTGYSLFVPDAQTIKGQICQNGFPAAC
jgi:hypothetical protein